MRLLDLHGRRAGEAAPDAIGAAGDSAAAQHFVRHWCRASWCQRLRRRMPALTTASFAGAATAAPYHLYSACLNLATERAPVYRSRKSEVFVFSKLYCGSPATGFVDTGVYRSGETKVARAMTISGAAVDSGLGAARFSPRHLRPRYSTCASANGWRTPATATAGTAGGRSPECSGPGIC